MQVADCFVVAEKALKQIRNGAFLIAQSGDTLNVMTIGWASIGFIWGRPIMTILVRKSRYTFTVIDQASEFTVSVPLVDARRELELCGSQSGRHIDKIERSGLSLQPGFKIKTPAIDIPGIHFECRIVYKSPMDPAQLIDLYKHLYPEQDFHTMYFGDIVSCYSTETPAGKTGDRFPEE